MSLLAIVGLVVYLGLSVLAALARRFNTANQRMHVYWWLFYLVFGGYILVCALVWWGISRGARWFWDRTTRVRF